MPQHRGARGVRGEIIDIGVCNTAAGEKLGAEALSGLARSFFQAGALVPAYRRYPSLHPNRDWTCA